MAVEYVKYRVPFCDTNDRQYRVDIWDKIDGSTAPATIILTPGDSPLVIDEDDSKEFFAPVRTQTGNLTVCTKIEPQTAMPNGGLLDLADIAPSNNTQHAVQVSRWDDTQSAYVNVWLGYLSCESYNQAYTDVPENIQLPINSVLEAWKSMYYGSNAKIVAVHELMWEMQVGTHFPFIIQSLVVPEDCDDFWELYINTTIFVKKTDYQNEESTLYKLEGKSYYDILETICKFLGMTARESGEQIYLQKLQGYGLLANTETRQMSALSWRGNNHQRSIVAGAKSVKVSASLDNMDIDTDIPEFPFSGLLASRDNRVDDGHYVYTLPSTDTAAYSNITMRQFKGNIRLGFYSDGNPYAFSHNGSSSVGTVISNSIAYDNYLSDNNAIAAYQNPNDTYEIYAGAFYARMQIDPYNDHDTTHSKTKDGVYMSLFPAAWSGYVGSGRNATTPIFEMRSVIAFTAYEEGYLVLNAKFSKFWDMPAVNAVGGDQCRFVFELQVGNKYWDAQNSRWDTPR